MKRILGRFIVWHRWLALPSCLFFGIWFVSGVVMMYARMPELTDADRLLRLPELNLTKASAFPGALSSISKPKRIILGMLNGRPAYRVLPLEGQWFSIYADDGSAAGETDSHAAIHSAAVFSGEAESQLSSEKKIVDVDQWTVYPASRPFLPFQVIRGNDSAGTTYYVSGGTGAVYLTTTSRGRFFAWCGAIPHWWYITALRSNNSLWHWVMIVASGWGVLMCIFGIAAGVMRYSPSKRYRFPGPRSSSVPHVGMKRWHYIIGYGFGFITFTWILSGLFSMNPGSWSPGPDASSAERNSFAGAAIDLKAFTLPPVQAWNALNRCLQSREIELIMFNGQPYYLGKGASSKVRLLPAAEFSAGCLDQVPVSQIVTASKRTAGGAAVASLDVLTSYDSYYYDRKYQKPLPVVRVRLTDPWRTWLYVNPKTALIEARYTERSRWERWLYNGLHSLDFPFLIFHRPLWDAVVIMLSIGGLTLSITGIVLTVRYFKMSYKRRSRPVRGRRSPTQA